MSFTQREAIGGGRRLRLGIGGPSRSGKTYSSLRVATGIAAGLQGKIFLIDTDNEFSLDYADDFKFQIVDFQSPFTSERYQEAVEYCVAQGAGVIVVDHMTHEHTGSGGMLERHEQVADDLAKRWKTSRDKTTWAAWSQVKAPHQKFVDYITRVKQPMIFNFRAKDKIKLVKKSDGKQDPVHIGYTPICAEQFDFEMTAMLILPPNSDGRPDKELSEIRKPLRTIMRLDDQLDESLGNRLAAWAAGSPKESAAPPAGSQVANLPDKTGTPATAADFISVDAVVDIEDKLKEAGIDKKEFLEAAGVKSLALLPAKNAKGADSHKMALRWIEQNRVTA